MGRKKKQGFTEMKMMATRVENSDFMQFEYILKNREGKNLQEAMNAFVREVISGNLSFSGSHIVEKRNV